MIGIGFGQLAHGSGAAFSAGTVWGVDFVNNYAEVDGLAVPLDGLISVARGSAGLHSWRNGIFETFTANVLRRTNRGILNEPEYIQFADNNIDYSGVVDGVLGAGGSLPDFMNHDNSGGAYTFTVAALTKFGLPFLSVSIVGTNGTGTHHFPNLTFASTAASSAAQGEDWVSRIRARISAGSGAVGGSVRHSAIRERDGNGDGLNQTDAVFSGPNFQDYVTAKTLSDASVDHIDSMIYAQVPPGEDQNITIEFGMWEVYKSSLLPQAPVTNTNNTPATQPADGLTLHLPSGTLDLTVQFDDTSQQTLGSVAGGDYLLPILNRPTVTKITGKLV